MRNENTPQKRGGRKKNNIFRQEKIKSMIATGQLQFKSNARAAEEFISLNGGLVGAYSHAESAGDFSLQKISYEEDCSYFKEALSLLGIIFITELNLANVFNPQSAAARLGQPSFFCDD